MSGQPEMWGRIRDIPIWVEEPMGTAGWNWDWGWGRDRDRTVIIDYGGRHV